MSRENPRLRDGDYVVDIFSREPKIYRVGGHHDYGMVDCQITPGWQTYAHIGIDRPMKIDPAAMRRWIEAEDAAK